MKHACENKHWAPTPEDIYVNPLDIEVFKSSHFARERKIQFIFFELQNAVTADPRADFIVCYDRTHALVFARNEGGHAYVLFDSQKSELSRYLIEKRFGPALSAADPDLSLLPPFSLQIDVASCVPFSVVYIHLRGNNDHCTAIRKLSLLSHQHVREFSFILLGLLNPKNEDLCVSSAPLLL